MVDDKTQGNDQIPDEYERAPWILREWRRAKLTMKLKTLFMVGLSLFGIWLMFEWFGWYFLLGLLPAPAWYFWALRQIDRDSYTVIEVRLKGDEKSTRLNSSHP